MCGVCVLVLSCIPSMYVLFCSWYLVFQVLPLFLGCVYYSTVQNILYKQKIKVAVHCNGIQVGVLNYNDVGL